ncbi:hypothetical protein [Arthrobacter sp. AFG7.2]|uniref:hypothetical protein n=1 Tax=Arthrobacter sp. AFG7.2 TaxID=1688693 RepID=UPI0011AF5530|nr:hypothetical protein [Arthrobacter sp. AFG7.2]
MTSQQISRLRGATTAGRGEDPELRRMLATHMHCGEPMQLVNGAIALLPGGKEETYDGGVLTYRCACGFSFDHRMA